MKIWRNPENGLYILEVPRTRAAEIAGLMAYRGLTFSTSASTKDKAILFTNNPYALADLADNVPELQPYKQAIEASRALNGRGTTKLPPGKELWDYQKADLDYLLARNGGILADQPGLGKRQPVDEPVWTPQGWKPIGELNVGDTVYAADGFPTHVLGIFNEAEAPVYRLTLSDGRTVRCDPEHLWEVEQRVGTAGKRKRTRIMTAKEMVDAGLRYRSGKPKDTRFYIPLVEPIRQSPKTFLIDPYVLGILIGDGALTSDKVAFSTMDFEIWENVSERLAPEWHVRGNFYPNCPQYYIASGRESAAFHHKISALGLRLKSPERFIPPNYFLGSIGQRLDLLRGLMDAEGSCSKNRTAFHSRSLRLAEDVAQLVRSLGGWAKIHAYIRGDGRGTDYSVNVKLHYCPFSLSRKKAQWRPTNIRLGILSIEPEGVAKQRCIKVACPRQLYVTSGYTLTHNTPTSIAFCNEVEAQRVLVIVPASVRIQWGERIREWSTLPNLNVSVMLKVKDGVHPTANYVVLSYDSARNPAIIRALGRYSWDVLICDEAHKMKNIDALTTRAILGNNRGEYQHGEHKIPAIATHAKRKLALTGTPLLNRPSEAFTLIRYFDHEAIDFMGWEAFKARYNRQADMKTVGGKRFKLESTSLETELQNRLRTHVMARHEKKDVLTLMKPPRFSIVRVEENSAVNMALDAEGMLGLSIEEIQTTKDFEILGHIAEARRLMGEAIAPQVIEYAKDFLEGSDEKLVIFGWHISVLDLLEEGLKNFGVVRVDGRKSPQARQNAVDNFVGKDDTRVFIGNILAAGVGLDGLQKVCSRCYIPEPDWVPANNEQAVARLDRIGQENLVNAEIFVAPGSISEKILVKALEKMNVIHRVLDAKEK